MIKKFFYFFTEISSLNTWLCKVLKAYLHDSVIILICIMLSCFLVALKKY